jgi:hypothetical protein
MASYGAFIAMQGFHYHGPDGLIRFMPKMNQGDFRSAFTVSEGWGSYHRKEDQGDVTEEIELKYGNLRLKTFECIAQNSDLETVRVHVHGQPVKAQIKQFGDMLSCSLISEIELQPGDIFKLSYSGR